MILQKTYIIPLLIFVLGLSTSPLFAQADSTQQQYKYALLISYFGHNLFHPGLKIGAEFPLWYGTHQKQKKRRLKTTNRVLLIGLNTAFYVHTNNHTGLIFEGVYLYRKLSRKTFKFEALINTSYLRVFNAGETYEVQDDDSVEEIKAAGRSYGVLGLGIGLGQDFSSKNSPLSWHFRSTANFQGPYNTSFNLFFSVEAGIAYQFKKREQ